jgi:LruC domain-containing protein
MKIYLKILALAVIVLACNKGTGSSPPFFVIPAGSKSSVPKGVDTAVSEGAKIKSIQIESAQTSILPEQHTELSAWAIYTDGNKINITDLAEWELKDPNLLQFEGDFSSNTSKSFRKTNSIPENGTGYLWKRFKALSPGSTKISATLESITGEFELSIDGYPIDSIEVSPVPFVPIGFSVPFKAMAIVRNGANLEKKEITTSVQWSVSNTNGTIEKDGYFTAVNPGNVEIIAKFSGLIGSTTTNLSKTKTINLSISGNHEIVKGTISKLQVTAIYEDGSYLDVTDQVRFTTSHRGEEKEIIKINYNGSPGIVFGVEQGSQKLSADLQDISTHIDVIVLDPIIASLSINPIVSSAKGVGYQYVAIATFTDGTKQNVTNQTTWISINPTRLSITNDLNNAGFAIGREAGEVKVIAAISKIEASSIFTVTPAQLISISISGESSIAKGLSTSLKAVGYYTDGTMSDLTNSVVWSKEGSGIITNTIGSSGLFSGNQIGTTKVTASLGNLTSSYSLEVTEAKLTKISIAASPQSIPVGMETQFTATGILTDNTKMDLTNSVTWMYDVNGDGVNDTYVASISNTQDSHGHLKGISKGNGKVLARYLNFTESLYFPITSAELVSVSLGAPQIISNGLQGKITAIGTFSDGTTKDITSEIKFSTSGNLFIEQSTGIFSTNGAEDTSVSATIGNLTSTLEIKVTKATLQSISLTSDHSTIAKGTKTRLKATGILTDKTTQDLTESVTWITDSKGDGFNDTLIASIDTLVTKGELLALQPGSVMAIAKLGKVTGGISLTVTPANLVSISLGSPKSIPNGLQLHITAIGTYTDHTTQDLTKSVIWSSSGRASIGSDEATAGVLKTQGEENVTITANSKGVLGTVVITVLPAEVTSLNISNPQITLAKGTYSNIIINGYYTDGSIQNITSQVTFSMDSNQDNLDDSSIASVSNQFDSKGKITAILEGKATLKATLNKISITSEVTVSPAELSSITITPPNLSLAKGLSQKLQATGFYTDQSTRDISSSVTWSISTPSLLSPLSTALTGSNSTSIGSISNSSDSKGLLRAENLGSADVIATFGEILGKTKVQVTNAELVTLNLSSSAGSKAKGLKEKFFAMGIYTDGTTQDLTTQVHWKSDSNADFKDDCIIACISNEISDKGLVTAIEVGETKIIATLGSISATKLFSVSQAILSSLSVESANTSVPNGLIEKVYAIGTYSDGTSRDLTSNVTWILDSDGDGLNDTRLASITNLSNTSGYIKTLDTGTIKIIASLGNISSNKIITILPAILKSITVYPPTANVVKGFVQQYTAIGLYTDESRVDITANATWISDSNSDGKNDTEVGSVSNETFTKGLVYGAGTGKSTITAIYENQTFSSILNVSAGTTVGSGKDGLVQLDEVSCKDTIFNFQANRVIGISAIVVDQKGIPVAGALVELFHPANNTLLFSQISSPEGKLSGSVVVNYTDTGILATMGANVTTNGAKQVSVPIRREENGDIKLVVNILGIQVSTETVNQGNPPVAVLDSDNDGVPDSRDAFPYDSQKAFKLRIPSTGYYTVSFEDLYPKAGDADLNDFTLYMVNEEDLNARGEIVEIRSSFQHVAKGAGYNHELRLSLPSGISVSSFETKIYDGSGNATNLGTIIEKPSSTITNALSIYNKLKSNFTLYNKQNVDTSIVFTPGYIAKTIIKFTTPVNRNVLGTAPYDLYAYVDNTKEELHFPGKHFVNHLNNVDKYVDSNGFPWAVIVPGGFQWPLERQDINTGYPKFSNWSKSYGAYDSDWYKHYYKDKVYTKAKEPNPLVLQ